MNTPHTKHHRTPHPDAPTGPTQNNAPSTLA